MALHANTVWEVRSTGNANNGGGFRSDAVGMDLSQQDSPEAVYTDLVIGNPTTTELSSAARSFIAADIGNIVNITAGTDFTTGRYQIVSVASGVATVDRSVGVAGSTGGSGRLGGAVAAFSDISAIVIAGNVVWIRASGGYTLGASEYTTSAAGTATAPITINGYGTERGDDEQATITAGNTTPTSILNIAHAFWSVRNLYLNAAGIVETCLTLGGADGFAENVTAEQWIETGIRATAASCFIQDCQAFNGTGGAGMGSGQRAGFSATAAGCLFERCVTQTSVSNGFMVATGVVADVRDSVAYTLTQSSATGGHGITAAGTGSIRALNCTFADLEGSGVYALASGGMADAVVQNCLLANIDRYGFESGSSDYSDLTYFARRFKNNAFYSCTLGRQDANFPAGVDEVVLTASPFVDLATGDLDLNNTPGGGREARAAGRPGVLPGLALVAGGLDIGALQSVGGGTDHQAMLDLFREWAGEFSETRLPDSVVNRYLQSGLIELNRILGYSFTDDTITLVASTQEYDQPDGTVEIVFVEHNGKRLEKADLDEWERTGKEWRSLPAGTPKFWAHYGDQVVLIPKPDGAAVAAAATVTVRFLRSPRDVGTYGPEGLVAADFRTAVRFAVREFSAAHPDSAAAQLRASQFEQMFNQAAQGAIEYYIRRRLSLGAPSEIQGASGTRRGKS